ncbi:hypothetical protein EJ377_16445 [Chryseobacterium arthrosphaerae]|uniref:Uncharacterized protein n=1 Tax=Chryseobacterium arthrosphaerae TaxID=651561 RepID=A0A3S0N1E4_9FLAO|nr:hypothetical protein EJ377_16445 [Chryseobacterium arthrosphaerae]
MNLKKVFIVLSCLPVSCLFKAQTLHLYGGADQDQYLGCLNCDTFDKNSIWNKFSDYGMYTTQNQYGMLTETTEVHTVLTRHGVPMHPTRLLLLMRKVIFTVILP